MASGIAAGTPRVVAEPGAHGRGTVVAPHLGGVVFTDSSEQLGIEPIKQRECFRKYNAVDGQVQSIDRICERFEDCADLLSHGQKRTSVRIVFQGELG